jgi:hypothetical protein
MSAAPTHLVGRYRLRASLGVGGMGRVWLAEDEILHRDVAVKEIILPPELIADDDSDAVRRRTIREARASARLSHPNVVRIYDVIEAGERPWIVMEYVPSRSLQQVIDEDGPLEPRRAAAIGLEVLAALDAAHRADVRHRDVKPANVLLADDGRVLLTDFGIAAFEGDDFVTGSGMVLGSPDYISPERARDGTAVPASDLWSLGATLYAAVEGRPPFKRPSSVETLTALAAAAPDPPQRAGALRPVLDGLLRKDPAARTDVAETRRRLEAAAAGERVSRLRRRRRVRRGTPPAGAGVVQGPAVGRAAVPAPAVPTRRPAATPDTRRRAFLATALAVLVLAVVVPAWWAFGPDPGSAAWRTPSRTAATAGDQAGDPAGAASASAGPGPGTQPPGPSAAAASSQPNRGGSGGGQEVPVVRQPALPAGWQDYRDPTGFAVYVPAGWTRSVEGSIVYFRDPRTGRVLGIDQTDRPKSDPVADWRNQASYRVQRGDFPGYTELRIASVPFFSAAADWEFTFNGRVRQHVNNRGFVVSPTKAYGIWWQTSDADWAAARPDLQLVFDSFRPAGR